MNTTITHLAPTDSVKLQRLNALFGEVFADDAYRLHQPSVRYLEDFLSDARHIVLVAEADGQLIGGLVAYVLSKFEQERKEVYVYDLAVATDVQRQGVGRELMGKLREVAAREGAHIVFVQADAGDAAVHFYRSLKPDEDRAVRNFDFTI